MFWTWLLKKGIKKNGNDLFYVNQKTPFWKAFILLLPALFIITLFIVIPFIYSIQYAFTEQDRYDTSIVKTSTKNFQLLFEDNKFTLGINNSIIFTLISVPLTIIFSIFISGAIANVLKKRLRGILQTIFFLPYITSAIAISITFAYIFDYDKGFVNLLVGKKTPWLVDTKGSTSMYVIIIFGIWKSLAFQILIFTTAMLAVDKTLYKSASIDGASKIKQFMYITLPSISKTINFIITISIIGAIKVMPLALFNNNSSEAMTHNASTLMLYIYYAIQSGDYFKSGAASIILVLVSISLSILIRKGLDWMMKGIERYGEWRVSNKINFK